MGIPAIRQTITAALIGLKDAHSLRGLRRYISILPFAFIFGFSASCGGDVQESVDEMVPVSQEPVRLGPTDGHDLPPADIERVAVGMEAPDFSLQTIAGDTLTLSNFRDAKNVVLVFYRGHW